MSIEGLCARVEGEDVLRGVDLHVPPGRVHALMGPNGSGKSTLAYVLAGSERFEVTAGTARYRSADLLEMEPHERALAGVFLSFQYPVEIPGVTMSAFLQQACNVHRQARGEPKLKPLEFVAMAREAAERLDFPQDMLKRFLNVGFSGGEKKRCEILQMAMLAPSFAIMDETDSGLDVDAMRLVARAVNGMRDQHRGFLVITHYRRLLDHLNPDDVSIMSDGRIVATGGMELVDTVERDGYDAFRQEVA